MRDFLIKWLVNIITLFIVIHVIAGVSVDSWQVVIVAAFALGFLNVFLKPFIILLTLPFNILSLGSFTLVINGFLLYLASRFVPGFNVRNFWSAFWAALLFSIISFLLNMLFRPKVNIRTNFFSHSSRGRPKDEDVIDVEGKIVD